jgi:hypothetical protein
MIKQESEREQPLSLSLVPISLFPSLYLSHRGRKRAHFKK